MNDLQIFNNEEFGEIRTEVINGDPWFCLLDVCKALDLSQPSKVSERLNEKGVNCIPTLTAGGEQNLLYITEPNLYKAIFQSRKPEAEKFSDWITSSVIPSIRKTGSYNIQQLPPNLQMAQMLLNQMAEQQLAISKVETVVENVKQAVMPITDNWREEINKKVTRICQNCGDAYREIRTEMYKLLEQRAGCDLDRRMQNLRYRMHEEGATKTQINSMNKLSVIEQDKKLREIFSKIVSEYEIKYCA